MEFKKQNIKASIVACIIDEQNRVLLTRRCIEPFCEQWGMPGGKIDHGEPLLEALYREVREEADLDVHIEFHPIQHDTGHAPYPGPALPGRIARPW